MEFRKSIKLDKADISEHLLLTKLRTIRSNPQYIIENLYVFNWESDMLLKLRSGYWYEYECKISLADFKHDFEKFAKHELLEKGEEWKYYCIKTVTDKSLLENYNSEDYHIKKHGKNWEVYRKATQVDRPKRPNYFSYCIPWYLEDKVTPLLPSYCGLVVLRENGFLDEVKVPPLLHKEKFTDEELNLCEKFYYNCRKSVEYIEDNKQEKTIKELRAMVDFLKAEYKAVTSEDISEVL